ncbi:hypothetical protein MMC30_000994 [Trapelia coarctata]|nr:hypothetical protein [Trapelia coarctata]
MRSLYRAAETIQKGFYIFREKTFDKLIIKVEEKDGMLLLTEGYYDIDDVLVPFPDELVKNERDRQAVLTHLTCADALGWMHDFMRLILKGFHAHLEEAGVKSKNFRRSTKIVSPTDSGRGIDSRSYAHAILKVTIPDRGSYALDIASAQCGYHGPIYPWAEYMKNRVESVVAWSHFGWQKQSFEKALLKDEHLNPWTSGTKVVGIPTAMFKHSMEFMRGFNTAVQEWLEKEGWTDFDKMLRMAPTDFEEKQSALLKDIEDYLRDFKEWQISRGRLGRRFKEMVPKSPEDKRMDELLEAVRKTKERTGLSTEVIMKDVVKKAIALKGTAEEKQLLEM